MGMTPSGHPVTRTGLGRPAKQFKKEFNAWHHHFFACLKTSDVGVDRAEMFTSNDRIVTMMMVGTKDVYLQMKYEPCLGHGLPDTQRPVCQRSRHVENSMWIFTD
jgi:hypothetical protein